MTVLSLEAPRTTREFRRIIGSLGGDRDGPTLVCVGGIHGNEISGILALERVFRVLNDRRPAFRGELVGIAGNLSALSEDCRFVDEDLNRIWMPERVAEITSGTDPRNGSVEAAEMRELLSALQDAFGRARGDVHFMDLHTSSAFGAPFVLLGDTLRNRALAFKFPVPVILGLEEQIDGVLLEYVNTLGHITLGFEAGQHDDDTSLENQESAVWIALLAAGNIRPGEVPEADEARARLADLVDHLPSVLEIRYRHGIEPDDAFKMREGYQNFQRVKAGEVVAHDRRGEIRVRSSGRILLPLYQGQGNDGFFLAREIRPFWLKVSAMLRHLHVHNLVPWLPGVRRHRDQPHTFIVNRHVARWWVLQIFHLLGFRKKRLVGNELIVSRRMYDLRGPNHEPSE